MPADAVPCPRPPPLPPPEGNCPPPPIGTGVFGFKLRSASRIAPPGDNDCFGRINPCVGVGADGTSSFGCTSTFGGGTLIVGDGCTALCCGTGALGKSLLGCSTGGGVTTGFSIGGATFLITLGSTLTASCGAGGGEGFKASKAPAGSNTVICCRPISSSSLVRTCGPKICGSKNS